MLGVDEYPVEPGIDDDLGGCAVAELTPQADELLARFQPLLEPIDRHLHQ